MPDTAAATSMRTSPSFETVGRLVLVSFVSLFFEMCLIRWISSEVRIFAYCKNLVLLASFFGLGWGFFRAARPIRFLPTLATTAALVTAVAAPVSLVRNWGPARITEALSLFSDFQIFGPGDSRSDVVILWWLAFGTFWTTVVFFSIGFLLFPYGQLTGRLMRELGRPLAAYSWNVAGALLGVLAFAAMSAAGTAPVYWFGVVLVLTVPLVARAQRVAGTFLALLALGLVAWSTTERRDGFEEIWTSYQKLSVELATSEVLVNNSGYQSLRPIPDFDAPGPPVDRFTMPYLTTRGRPRTVAILGAGIGNDVNIALAAGARRVVAVEIDREIQRIGTWLNPRRPYADPRVRVVIDDARRFLRTNDERFDLIVFSHLDSHTLLSSHTNVRLDNYIYTVECLRDARRTLAPGGLLYLSFWANRPWIVARLHRNLTLAFGHPPLTLLVRHPLLPSVELAHYLQAESPPGPDLADQRIADWSAYTVSEARDHDVPPSTDDWPFLYVERRRVPALVAVLSAVIFGLLFVGIRRATARAGTVVWHYFWLGAAFILLEVHNVSKLALLFGTTWQVNTWVIGGILSMILLGNVVASRIRSSSRWPCFVALWASLVLGLALPVDALASLPLALAGLAAVTTLTLPIFFAAITFALLFRDERHPEVALGSNMLGAVLGGVLESAAFVTGLGSLMAISLLLYVLAWLAVRRAERVAAA